MSFADRHLKSGAVPIHFVRCKDTAGRKCYFFLQCSPMKAKTVKLIADGNFNINDYGTVIASGFGHKPSDTVRKKLKEEYNCDADSLIKDAE